MAARQGQGVVLGYLKYVLGFDSLAFEKGAGDAEKRMRAFQRSMTKMADGFKDIGASATRYITLPVAAVGAGILKMAGDFETAMNDVAISTQATSSELAQMKELALDIGKSTTKSASESAQAMDMLAKAGLSTTQILNGAARATVALAEAAGSDLEPAAAAVTDSMTQFKLGTEDLPKVINQITGAVNESKMAFADFQGAASQAGGVAASLGVSFEDFNAVLAGTSANFASGSDAGTSFKTFLTTLTGKSSTALGAMQRLGLSFYDASGRMKSMSEIAQMLRDKLGGLSEEARTNALRDIFGTDAMRTAIGLMDLGAEGLDKIKAKIAQTDAAAQSAQRMKGLNAELEKLGGAFETLAIKIADAGLISAVTAIVSKIGEFVDWMSQANPELLKWGTILAVVAAAIGPVLFAIGGMVSAVGALVPLLGGAGLTGALGAVAPLLGPIALAVGGLAAAWALFGDKIGPVLSDLGTKVQKVLGPKVIELFNQVSATLTELWNGPFGEAIRGVISILGDLLAAILRVLGPALISILSAAVDVFSGAFKLIGGLLTAVSRLLSGDFSGAWEAAKGAVIGAVAAIANAIDTLTGGALTWIGNMVIGIRDWLVNKLGAIFDWVGNKIETVKGFFYGLYDAVVGHSYIPDMVDGIKAQMDRLDAAMVQPIKKATDKSKEAFREMAQETKALLDRLFPEVAKLRQLEHDLTVIDKSGLTPEQQSEARYRLMDESIKSNKPDESWKLPETDIDNSDAMDRWMKNAADEAAKMSTSLGQSLGKSGQAFVDMAQTAIGALRGIVDAIRNGDWLDIVQSILDAVLQVVGFAMGNAPAGSGVGGARARGGPVKAGETYLVGERGPEMFTANRGGFITPNRAMQNAPRRGGNVTIYAQDAVLTSAVRQWVREGMEAAQYGAVSEVEQRGAKRERRRLGRSR